MKTYNFKNIDQDQLIYLIQRPKMDFESIFKLVNPIIEEVRLKGDAALISFTEKFDGVKLETASLDPTELDYDLDLEVKEAIDIAFENIQNFHEAQMPEELVIETMPGIKCSKVVRPIERVGIYVPGGTAILPSTAMMLSIPAMIAGCGEIVLATPPNKEGNVAPEIIYIAQKAGISKILLAGGAQAVAAMAFGTETVPKVDKILGPGNQYVTAAKMILQNSEAQISIDMPAGPSEVLVIADEQAKPAYVAADLLSQAEHGVDSQVVLGSINGFNLDLLRTELEVQTNELERAEIASKALENSFIVEVDTEEEAFAFSNAYAPEHLIVNIEDAAEKTDLISNAGSVFLGQLTPESVGDYASGTNHTLPTYGYARMYSGVNLASYFKSITMQELNAQGLKNVGPAVEILAQREGLQAHKNAVTIRLKDLN